MAQWVKVLDAKPDSQSLDPKWWMERTTSFMPSMVGAGISSVETIGNMT